MSWSRQGYENASYCISHTGRQPAMQSPTAPPRIPASASGASTHRFSPKRSRSPAVARKTPPARPTSSPSTITVSSRASSTWSASFTASTRNFSAIPALAEVRGRDDIGVVEDELRVRLGLGFGRRDPLPHRLEGVVLDLLGGRVVEHAELAEIAVVAADALVALLLLDALEVDIGPRVVGRRVRSSPVRDRFDEGRSAAGAGSLDGLPRRLVHREHVAAVDAHAGHPVPDGLVGERLRARLRLDRGRDRPLVVVAEEDQRRLHDSREIRALVERTFARRAVAEVRDRDGGIALQLLATGKPGSVGDLRPDRHADRGDPVLRRVPPAGRMAPPPVQHGARRHPSEQPDRRLPVAREDPVSVVERVHRAGLHRLVVPEDRVRADAALAVVDERALVVRAQQDERAVDREQLARVEAVDLALLVDDAPQLTLPRGYLGHRGSVVVRSAESR